MRDGTRPRLEKIERRGRSRLRAGTWPTGSSTPSSTSAPAFAHFASPPRSAPPRLSLYGGEPPQNASLQQLLVCPRGLWRRRR